jgi:hypothetical protein
MPSLSVDVPGNKVPLEEGPVGRNFQNWVAHNYRFIYWAKKVSFDKVERKNTVRPETEMKEHKQRKTEIQKGDMVIAKTKNAV